MRISDWSSDVCSSDLRVYPTGRKAWVLRYHAEGKARLITLERGWPAWPVEKARREAQRLKLAFDSGIDPLGERQRDRKSGVWGMRGSVRVDLGGRRMLIKKQHNNRYSRTL